MKVLVIGGTGVFGALLCDLLDRDGHAVTIASRSTPENAAFPHLQFDRNGPLDAVNGFDVVVDAAGPFHAYGNEPYRVARAAIAVGAHYFDLSDNADFCQGINVLDAEAKAAGVSVVSGMSSVPAISSAVATALCEGQQPLMIESAIVPGNKAPRGRSVVESILSQTGMDYQITQDGRQENKRSWSDPRVYDIGKGHHRQAWRIEVPDQRLFPQHFNCPTVTFRAGLELGVMNYSLGVLSWLRGHIGFKIPNWMVSGVLAIAKLLASFGTDVGGMVVAVTVPDGTGFTRKSWILLAENGDGPYTPTVAIRAACREIEKVPYGAFPALGVVGLDAINSCFDDLDITTTITEMQAIPPFKAVLADSFDDLDPVVRATHDAVTPRRFSGKSSVTRGTGFLARVAALVIGFPPTGDDVPVSVTKVPSANGETWVRQFGKSIFKSYLSQTSQGGMRERFGPMVFDIDLTVKDGTLQFPLKRGRCLGIPIPSFLLPKSEATEYVKDGRFHFDVHLKSPTGATLVHYRGWLVQDT